MIGELVSSLLCAVDLANVVPAYMRINGSSPAPTEIRIEQNAVVILRPPILELPMNCTAIVASLRSIGESLAISGVLTMRPSLPSRRGPGVPIPELTYGQALDEIAKLERELGVRRDPHGNAVVP